jgi:hypothetical protein
VASSITPPYSNVFKTFLGVSQGAEKSAPSWTATPNAKPAQGDSTLDLLRVLKMLASADEHRLPFTTFASALPGDSVATLSSVVQMMSKGWVEISSPITDSSDVRITDVGLSLLSTLEGGSSAST